MEKEFVPYEHALALKGLVFDEPCFGYYTHNEKLCRYGSITNSVDFQICTHSEIYNTYSLAPTFSQVFRWFREKHNLWSMVYPREGWNYSIQRIDETISCTQESFHSIEINTYKETELACLIRLIKIVKEKI